MCERGVSGHQVCSILGYCLLPMIFLGFFSTFKLFHGYFGMISSFIFIFWSTWSSAGMFVNSLEMKSKKLIIAYPIFLLYITFGMLSVF
jgi:protein YIPF5/7